LGHVVVRGHLVPEAPREVLGQIGQVLAGGHRCSSRGIVAGQQVGGGCVRVGVALGIWSALVVGQWEWGHRLLVVREVLLLEVVRRLLLVVVRVVLLLLWVARRLLLGVMLGGAVVIRSTTACPAAIVVLVHRTAGGRGREGRGRGMGSTLTTVSIGGLTGRMVAQVTAMLSGCGRGSSGILQLGTLQIQDVRYVEARALR